MTNNFLNIDDLRNTIQLGHVLDVLKEMPSESVNCLVTSPPYWSLRDYGNETETIWDAVEGCEHEWKKGKIAGDIRFRPGHNTKVGNETNPDVWIRPSREEFGNIDSRQKCIKIKWTVYLKK